MSVTSLLRQCDRQLCLTRDTAIRRGAAKGLRLDHRILTSDGILVAVEYRYRSPAPQEKISQLMTEKLPPWKMTFAALRTSPQKVRSGNTWPARAERPLTLTSDFFTCQPSTTSYDTPAARSATAMPRPLGNFGVWLKGASERWLMHTVGLTPNPPKRWALSLTQGLIGRGRQMGQAQFQLNRDEAGTRPAHELDDGGPQWPWRAEFD